MKNYRFVFKKLILPLTIGLFVFASLQPISNNLLQMVNLSNTQSLSQPPAIASQYQYNDPYIGKGNNQTTWLFLQNASSTIGHDNFTIPSVSNNEFLNQGSYNFTLSSNNTYTNYTLEPFDPLNYPTYQDGFPNNNITVNTGAVARGNNTSIYNYNDFDNFNHYANVLILNSSVISPNLLEFSLNCNLSNSIPYSSSIVGFNITFIAAPTNSLFNITSLNANVSKYNQSAGVWNLDRSNINFNNTPSLSFFISNPNNLFVNSTNSAANFTFDFFNSTATFNMQIDQVIVNMVHAVEVPLTHGQVAALEFNTLGNATVYGFQSWIRAMNTTTPGETTNLTVTLYRSNMTTPIIRDSSSGLLATQTVQITPNNSTIPLAQNSFLNYSGDGLVWLSFNHDYSGVYLNVSEYFIVISSNATGGVGKGLSLVTIPYNSRGTAGQSGYVQPAPDLQVDHLLLSNTSPNPTYPWSLVNPSGYADQCNAANFTLNLTRAWLPSEINLQIENQSVSNTFSSTYPCDTSGFYGQFWWGLGAINHTYTNPVQGNNGNFTVIPTWYNLNTTAHLDMAVSYNVTKYLIQNSTSEYILTSSTVPNWNVTFTYNSNNYPNWQFSQYWVYYPTDWIISGYVDYNYTNIFAESQPGIGGPNATQIFEITNASIISGNGNYTFIAASPNYIQNCTLNLQYGNNFWPTNGFMVNDNATVDLSVSPNPNIKYLPITGTAKAQLFDPSGSIIPYALLTDNDIDVNGSAHSVYNFGHQHIIEVNQTTPSGQYTVMTYWLNGNEAGIFQRNMYVNQYSADKPTVQYDRVNKVSKIWGVVNTFDTDLNAYELSIYAVNKLNSTQIATMNTNYMLNRTENEELWNQIYITNFAQSETYLNAGDNVSFQIKLQNENPLYQFDVNISVGLVYYLNPDMQLANATSNATSLAIYGSANNQDQATINLTVQIPTEAQGGLNCPIRNSPLQVMISLFSASQNQKAASALLSTPLLYSPETDQQFIGNVTGFNDLINRVGPSYISSFVRSETNLPGTTYYFIQIMNNYYMTMNYLLNASDAELLDGNILNLQSIQSNLNHTSIVNITGQAVDEFNNSLGSVKLYLKYYNYTDNIWYDCLAVDGNNYITTNQDGTFNTQIPLIQTPLYTNVTINFHYQGLANLIMDFNQTLTIIENQFTNSFTTTLSILTLNVNEPNIFSIVITNTGNSTLKDINETYGNNTFAGSILPGDINQASNLPAGGIYIAQLYMFEGPEYQYSIANFTLNITAHVSETNETILQSLYYSVKVYRTDETQNLTNLAIGIFVSGIIGIWAYAILYIRKKYIEFNQVPTPTESKPSRQRRGGRYVKVSELAKETPSKTKEEETPAPPKPEGKSLDDLMEKEGIEKKD